MAGSVEQIAWVLGQEFPDELTLRLIRIADNGDSGTAELARYGFEPPAEPQLEPRKKKAPIPLALRWEVWERDDFTCRRCGARQRLTVDHVIPESRGGPTVLLNLQTLCGRCNNRKGVS